MRTLFSVFVALFFAVVSLLLFLVGDPHGGSLPNSLIGVRHFLSQRHLLAVTFFLGPVFMFITFFSMFLTIEWGIKLFRPKCSKCGRRTHYVGSRMDSVDFDTLFYKCRCGNFETSSSMGF